MSDVFTIREVGEPREWSSEKHGGRFLAYPVTLEDAEGKHHIGVEWSRKADSKAPQVEDRIAGTIQGGQYGDKLKVDYDATKELKDGSSRQSKSREWKPEHEYDPAKTAVIDRGVSLKVAAAYCASQGKPYGLADLFAAANEIEADLHKVRAKAANGAGAVPTLSAPAPDAGICQRFSEQLEAAGVNAAAATLIVNWVFSEWESAEEQDAALKALEDPEKRERAIERLRERYEGVHGELPEAAPVDDFEDVPF